ncbi:MAG: hypothetical protein ACYDC1_19465 [Limisphaerales bacterium]
MGTGQRIGIEIGIFLMASMVYLFVIYQTRRAGMPVRGWWSNEGMPLGILGVFLIGLLVLGLHFAVH